MEHAMEVLCINNRMLEEIRSDQSYAMEILSGVVAHEFGHILQLRNDCFLKFSNTERAEVSPGNCFSNLEIHGETKLIELHADFMAGWTCSTLGLLTTSSFGGFSKRVFTDGDDGQSQRSSWHAA